MTDYVILELQSFGQMISYDYLITFRFRRGKDCYILLFVMMMKKQ